MRAALLVLALLLASPLAAAEPVPCAPGAPSDLGVGTLTCDESAQGEHTKRTTRAETSLLIFQPFDGSEIILFVTVEHTEINGEGATCRVTYWAPNGPGARNVQVGQPCPGQTPPNPTPPEAPELPALPTVPAEVEQALADALGQLPLP